MRTENELYRVALILVVRILPTHRSIRGYQRVRAFRAGGYCWCSDACGSSWPVIAGERITIAVLLIVLVVLPMIADTFSR